MYQPRTTPEEASVLERAGIATTNTTERDPLFDERFCTVHAELSIIRTTEAVVGIRLQHPEDEADWALVHKNPCANEGPWRATYLDAMGPSGHSPRSTMLEAVMEARSRGYRAVEVVLQRQVAAAVLNP